MDLCTGLGIVIIIISLLANFCQIFSLIMDKMDEKEK